ncbi:hypothetical protein DER29_2646 [Micromonospora sp. M71_S20]|nr:hypothetical protein DER29_2646 [Micromonospora sp. M71_S20]
MRPYLMKGTLLMATTTIPVAIDAEDLRYPGRSQPQNVRFNLAGYSVAVVDAHS